MDGIKDQELIIQDAKADPVLGLEEELQAKIEAAPEGAADYSLELGFEPLGLPLHAEAGSERRVVVLQEAAGEAAVDLAEGHARIDIEVPVESVIDKERALVEVTGAVGAGCALPHKSLPL